MTEPTTIGGVVTTTLPYLLKGIQIFIKAKRRIVKLENEIQLNKEEREEFEEIAETDMGVGSPSAMRAIELKYKEKRNKERLNGVKKRGRWASIFLMAYSIAFVIILALAVYGIHEGFYIAIVITFALGMVWVLLPLED